MQGVYNWRGGGGGEDGVCDCLTCDHDGPDVGSEQGAYNWGGGGGGGKMGSVTASPVIMMVLMLALCRVCITGVV